MKYCPKHKATGREPDRVARNRAVFFRACDVPFEVYEDWPEIKSAIGLTEDKFEELQREERSVPAFDYWEDEDELP